MNRKDLIDALATKTDSSKAEARTVPLARCSKSFRAH